MHQGQQNGSWEESGTPTIHRATGPVKEQKWSTFCHSFCIYLCLPYRSRSCQKPAIVDIPMSVFAYPQQTLELFETQVCPFGLLPFSHYESSNRQQQPHWILASSKEAVLANKESCTPFSQTYGSHQAEHSIRAVHYSPSLIFFQ